MTTKAEAIAVFDNVRAEIVELENKISHGAASPADLEPLKQKFEAIRTALGLNESEPAESVEIKTVGVTLPESGEAAAAVAAPEPAEHEEAKASGEPVD